MWTAFAITVLIGVLIVPAHSRGTYPRTFCKAVETLNGYPLGKRLNRLIDAALLGCAAGEAYDVGERNAFCLRAKNRCAEGLPPCGDHISCKKTVSICRPLGGFWTTLTCPCNTEGRSLAAKACSKPPLTEAPSHSPSRGPTPNPSEPPTPGQQRCGEPIAECCPSFCNIEPYTLSYAELKCYADSSQAWYCEFQRTDDGFEYCYCSDTETNCAKTCCPDPVCY